MPSTISCQKLDRPLLTRVVFSSGRNSLNNLASPFYSDIRHWPAIGAINNATELLTTELVQKQNLLF